MRLLVRASSLLDLTKDEASYLDAPLIAGEANFLLQDSLGKRIAGTCETRSICTTAWDGLAIKKSDIFGSCLILRIPHSFRW